MSDEQGAHCALFSTQHFPTQHSDSALQRRRVERNGGIVQRPDPTYGVLPYFTQPHFVPCDHESLQHA